MGRINSKHYEYTYYDDVIDPIALPEPKDSRIMKILRWKRDAKPTVKVVTDAEKLEALTKEVERLRKKIEGDKPYMSLSELYLVQWGLPKADEKGFEERVRAIEAVLACKKCSAVGHTGCKACGGRGMKK